MGNGLDVCISRQSLTIYSWNFKKFLNTEVMQFFIAKFIPPSSEGAFLEDQHLGHRKGHWTGDSEFVMIQHVHVLCRYFK